MRVVFLGTALLLAAASGASADQAMTRRAGEWQVTRVNGPGETGAPAMRKTCYAADQTLESAVTKGMTECSKKDVKTSGTVLSIDAVCTLGSSQVSVKGTISKSGEDAFHTESHMHFDKPQPGTPADVTIVTDAKRLGACQPGETPQD